jgi:CRP/FNR family cyclic AMP-dependent transcriptional regulator
MATKVTPRAVFNLKVFLTKANGGRTNSEFQAKKRIFVQGETANAIFYIREGKVKLSVISKQGKEAVVAFFGNGDFFGEGCLAGQQVRMATAVAISECSVLKLEKTVVVEIASRRTDVRRTVPDPPSFSQHQD